jgi:hypothetical protein
MQDVFTLIAQVLGQQRSVVARSDGYGFSVTTESGTRSARTLRGAIQIAREDLGRYLARAWRRGLPWGLYVSVASAQAVYGDWPLLPVGGGGPSGSEELITKIRRRYTGNNPRAALENAIDIIEAYTERRRRAA